MLFLSNQVSAKAYALPADGSRLIGEPEYHTVKEGDYFHALANLYNVGFLALMDANPGVDPLLPQVGTKIVIPSQIILPDAPYKGIVINLPELRLYYFTNNTVYVFPIGIGRIDQSTPVMETTIFSKIPNPTWTPTKQSREDHFAEHGTELPQTVPAGKNNPLGEYALRLAYGNRTYLIHGTNKNFGIGMRVSAGCVRMNPDDIAWLFAKVKSGESVKVINDPIKITKEPNGEKYIEVHSPLTPDETSNSEPAEELNYDTIFTNNDMIDWDIVAQKQSCKED
ncbi:L,D-transpeptidase family protein [Psychromonas sp. MME1]|uniref:L,D-transpeptidase family protein n=1 Tax=Psychromonas sp. MME1 TaxID=3231032 RepID=UPI0034E2512B